VDDLFRHGKNARAAAARAVSYAGRTSAGRTTKVQAPQPAESAMHYNEVSKWFHFTARRGKGGAISGALHQHFAFESLASDSWEGFSLVGWVCQGDARFTARPRC
jgi:hypothetical protein